MKKSDVIHQIMNLPHFHIIEVSYLAPINTRWSRVKLYSHRFKKSKIIEFEDDFNTLDNAVNYLLNNGFTITCKGESKNGYFIGTTTFKSL